MPSKIPISQLGVLSYCEYRIYLKEHLKKQKVRVSTIPNAAMLAGLQAHRKLKKENEKVVQTPQKQINRELNVIGDRLRGRMDEIIKTPTYIKIIDDKPHDNPYQGDKWQVFGYCLAYTEQHPDLDEHLKIYGAIRNWKTKTIIWEKEYTDKEKKEIYDCIDKITSILDGSVKAKPTSNPNKCRRCNLKHNCDMKPVEISIDDILGM